MTLRRHYEERIRNIRTDVVRMGNLALEMNQKAVDALMNGDSKLVREVIDADEEVDALESRSIQETCLLLLQESPVASDLRFLTATLGVIGEIEKVADDTVKLARRAGKLSGRFPTEMKASLRDLALQARHAFGAALRLYADYSPELAREIIEADVLIDAQYAAARKSLIQLIRKDTDKVEDLLRCIDAFRSLEHVADRAEAIADRLSEHYGVLTHERLP